MEVVDKTSEFKDYLERFPQLNREGMRDLPFWPSDMLNQNGDGNIVSNRKEEGPNLCAEVHVDGNRTGSAGVDLIMSTMPNPERRVYFGPRKDRPPQEMSRRVTGGRRRGGSKDSAPEIVRDANEDPFPAFNPEKDVVTGQFVALTVELREIREGVPFYIGKVLEFGQGRWTSKMKILWYWPTMRPGTEEEAGSNKARYTNCIESTWEPSGERFAWIEKEAAIYSWMDVPRRGRSGHVVGSNITVHGVQTEEVVVIPVEAKPHLLEYLAMQMEDLDDERLHDDLNTY
jgi:hypothetical protein